MMASDQSSFKGEVIIFSSPERVSDLQVSVAVGVAGFACVMLTVFFLLIKYRRRSKFSMKGETLFLNILVVASHICQGN